MKKAALILMLLMSILIVGCNKSNVEEIDNPTASQVEGKSEVEKEEIKVTIECDVKNSFFSGEVNFTPVLEGETDTELQYHWIIEGAGKVGDDILIDGFSSKSGPVTELINSGEAVQFGVYAEVSYVEGAYSERKVILKVEEKDTGKVLATDELTIENREGLYTIKPSNDKKLINTILETSKARLYAKIFDRVWGIDSGLNSDVKYISIDTKTFEEFDEIDKAQLFEYLEKRYGAIVFDKSMDELEAEGYIKDSNFEHGIVFKIDKYKYNSEDKVFFDGTKWASGIGAIGFRVEARYKNGDWVIEKCDMTWIS